MRPTLTPRAMETTRRARRRRQMPLARTRTKKSTSCCGTGSTAVAVTTGSAGDNDRSFSYLAEYRVQPKTFIRLADEDLRTVSLAPKQRFAIGQDDREYELLGNLDGRRFQDIYVIDMATGARRLALKRARWYNGPSPDGKSLPLLRGRQLSRLRDGLGPDAQHHAQRPDQFRRHRRRPQRRQAPGRFDWLDRDSASVLLTDNWDIWQVPVNGGTAVNLTANGRKDQIRYQRRYPDRAAAGARPRHRSHQAAVLCGLRRVDEEGRHRAAGAGQAGRGDAQLVGCVVRHADQGEGRRAVHLHPFDGDRAKRLLHHRCDFRERRSADRPASAGGVIRVDRRLDARQLHERQGRQAAGRALPARPATRRASRIRPS